MTQGTADPPHAINPAGRPLSPLSATSEERGHLREWAQGGNPRLARRAALILACLEGASNRAVAARLRMSKQAVGKWRARFQRLRVHGLLDQPRSGAPRRIGAEDVARVIVMARQPPPPGLPRWTTRSMARACGLSQTTVNRIWRLHGLAPHRAQAAAPPDPADGEAGGGEPASPSLDAEPSRGAPRGNSDLIVELRRALAGLAQMVHGANPAALRVAVDAVEAAWLAAGSTNLHRRPAAALAPEVRARQEARWRRARALFEEAKATLRDTVAEMDAPGPTVGQTSGRDQGTIRPRRMA